MLKVLVISAQADYDNAQSALQVCENRRSELEQIPNSELTQDQYTELQRIICVNIRDWLIM